MALKLGAPTAFSSVSTTFYQEIYSWTWLPTTVDVSVSNDGTTFTPAGSIATTVPETTGGVVRKDYRIDGQHTARYVRLTAHSRLTCPGWHIGTGKPCWLFIDEIVVR